MAGKFNLLTIMTLNAAGYKAGIDDAKKSTQSLVNGTNTAVNSIGSHFSKLGGMTSGVIAPLNGIKGAVMSGIGSFKAMIPAINSVKMAIVSTGIGAIVVALGLAFAALTTYLSGTSEGSKKLREMLGYVSGAVTALMNRVKYLGGALFSLLTGDIEGFKKNIKEAFASGFIDEVVKSAKESNEIEKEKSANIKIQRDLKTQISALEKESALLNQKFRDPKLSDGERLKYLEKMLDVEDNIEATKLNAAKAELKYRQDIVNLKGISANGEDKDALADAMVALDNIQTARINTGTRAQRAEAKLLNSIKADEKESYRERLEEAKKYSVDLISTIQFTQDRLNKKGEVKGKEDFKPVATNTQDFQADKLTAYADGLQVVAERQQAVFFASQSGWEQIKQSLDLVSIYSDMAGVAIGGLTDAFTGLFEGTVGGFKDVVTNMLQGIQSIINGLLAQAVAAMIAKESTKGLIGLITAAVGVAALIGLWKSKVPAFESGGIVGGSSFSGDKIHARVNSGEMILNRTQQANLFAMANGAGSGGANGGTVEFKIQGNALVGVLENQGKRIKNMR